MALTLNHWHAVEHRCHWLSVEPQRLLLLSAFDNTSDQLFSANINSVTLYLPFVTWNAV